MPTIFKKLMLARFFFTFAVQMQAIVLGWRMYELTKDPLYLGLIGLIEAIPALGLALYAGHVVDQGRPLVIYRRLTFVSLTSGFIMLLSQIDSNLFGDHLSSKSQVILLFVSSFLTGCARAFSQPSMYSLIPKIIPRAMLSKSSAWMSSAMQTARMSGPAVGGILYGFLGISGTATIICLCLALTTIILFTISFNPPSNSQKESGSITNNLLSGVRFVFKHPLLLPAMSLDMVSVLFGGVTALLPVYAAEILFIGPEGLGVLRAAPAIGAFVMSTWLIRNSVSQKAGAKLFISVAGFGISILIFAFSRNYILSLVSLILSGMFDSVSIVIRTSLVQLSSPDHMRGRISAVNSIFIGSSNELGEFESGVAAKILGTFPAAVFGGCMCLMSVIVVFFISPKLRKLDFNHLENLNDKLLKANQ
jgi:MFS family permease